MAQPLTRMIEKQPYIINLPLSLKYTVTQYSVDALALGTVLAFFGSKGYLEHTAAGGDAVH